MTDRPRDELPGIDPDEPQRMDTGGEGEGSDRIVRPGPPATPRDPWGKSEDHGGEQDG